MRVRSVLLPLVVFAVAILSREALFAWPAYAGFLGGLPEGFRWLEQPVRWLLCCGLGLYVGHRQRPAAMLRELGLRAPAGRGLLFAFLACTPLLLGPLAFGRLNPSLTPLGLLFSAGIWPLAEEILFRGYLFGQLHRRAGLGFWSAALLSGSVFGVLHLGQASVQRLPLSGEIGTVLLISAGGLFFAWLYVRWADNLWVPFGMHLFMNAAWDVYDLADNPLGGWLPNVLRVLCVVLALGLTLYRDRLPFFRLSGT